MIDKVLVVIVTRDNSVLLNHMMESFSKYDPGYPCDYLIVDNSSESHQQKKLLESLSKKYRIMNAPNDRVEASFDLAWKRNKEYMYYFFLHDDSCANKDNWLKVFVDRMNSGYREDIIKDNDIRYLPIGKVGAQTQYWRNYSSVLGYSVQCNFLEKVLEVLRPGNVPGMFKYSDCDRVLIKNECLENTNGIRSVKSYKTLQTYFPEKYEKICEILNKYLNYPDSGIPPFNLYPSGQCWNKFCLTAEMMNSVDPLIEGWRTVGLEGDGYLEEIHGYDVMWGNNYIHHYGSPNFRSHIARVFETDKEEIKKHFNNKIMLMKFDQIVHQYYKDLK